MKAKAFMLLAVMLVLAGSVVVSAQKPEVCNNDTECYGGCNCDYCMNNIDDLIVKYLDFIKENAEPERLFFVTWFANVKEHFEFQPI